MALKKITIFNPYEKNMYNLKLLNIVKTYPF